MFGSFKKDRIEMRLKLYDFILVLFIDMSESIVFL